MSVLKSGRHLILKPYSRYLYYPCFISGRKYQLITIMFHGRTCKKLRNLKLFMMIPDSCLKYVKAKNIGQIQLCGLSLKMVFHSHMMFVCCQDICNMEKFIPSFAALLPFVHRARCQLVFTFSS